jgi:DNA polymerase-3 subunit beta
MKITCNQKELVASLAIVNRAVPTKPTHPVLANVLMVADVETNQVSFTAFDLSLGIHTTIDAKVENGGSVAIPSSLLLNIVSKLPDGYVDIELVSDVESFSVNIKTKSGKYEIRALSADEYPELPSISGNSILIPSTTLLEGLRGVLFSTSQDETRQILTGVHLKVRQNTFDFAATDGHRLSIVEITNDEFDTQDLDVTIPAKSLKELEKMLSVNKDSDTSVKLTIEDGQVDFEWLGCKLTSRTLEGQYPMYRQLLPKQFDKVVTLDRKVLISALDRISVLADQKSNIVKVSIDADDSRLVLSCEAQETGYGHELMPATIQGNSIDIAFNVKYLMEGLKALPSSEIQMLLNAELTPVIFTPLGGLKMIYLAMPVQLRS